MEGSFPILCLQRCAQAMEKVVIPNLTDNNAIMQARAIALLLNAVAPVLEEKGKELMIENDGMKQVLRKVLKALRSEINLSSNAVSAGLIRELDLELQKGKTKYRDLTEENHRLKGALVKVIKGLDALSEDLPMKKISSLRQQIRSVLRQQLDRELALVLPYIKSVDFKQMGF